GIATVSEGCRNNFLKNLSHLSDKTYVVRNCNNFNEILKKSNDTPIYYRNDGIFNIITVARLSNEKGLLPVIKVIKDLVNKNYNVKWHLIGQGPLEGEIKEMISQ